MSVEVALDTMSVSRKVWVPSHEVLGTLRSLAVRVVQVRPGIVAREMDKWEKVLRLIVGDDPMASCVEGPGEVLGGGELGLALMRDWR